MGYYNEKDMYNGKEYEKEKCKEKDYEKELELQLDICDCKFAQHIRKFIGDTVTIYTASGGISGAGFTGFLIDVNCCFVRIVSKQGPEPACPLGSACNYESECASKDTYKPQKVYTVGAVSDIPIDKIVAFTHNAV